MSRLSINLTCPALYRDCFTFSFTSVWNYVFPYSETKQYRSVSPRYKSRTMEGLSMYYGWDESNRKKVKYTEKDLPSYRLLFPHALEAKTDVPPRFEACDQSPEERQRHCPYTDIWTIIYSSIHHPTDNNMPISETSSLCFWYIRRPTYCISPSLAQFQNFLSTLRMRMLYVSRLLFCISCGSLHNTAIYVALAADNVTS
jgi:hypothetical protein